VTLLFVGDGEDLTLVYLSRCASVAGFETVILDESRFGVDWRFETSSDSPADGLIHLGTRSIAFSSVAGAYVRFSPTPGGPISDQLGGVPGGLYARERRHAIHVMLWALSCPVVNPPASGMSNASKPLQMRLLREAGFRVPRWIATNDPREARDFSTRCRAGAVIKAMSGYRAEVQLIDEALLSRLGFGSPPVIVQERIEGFDVRLHIIAERAFATSIRQSGGIDYRWAGEGAIYECFSAPDDLVSRAAEFARREGLILSGLDFRVDVGGEWYCLECNPVPTFSPYELATGQAISAAIIDVFRSPRN
jgi:hypothetical protein